jgi:hypothetical protein
VRRAGLLLERGGIDGEAAIRAWLEQARRLAAGALAWDELIVEDELGDWWVELRAGPRTAHATVRRYERRIDRYTCDEDLLRLANELIARPGEPRRLTFVDLTEHEDEHIFALVLVTPEAARRWAAAGLFLDPDPGQLFDEIGEDPDGEDAPDTPDASIGEDDEEPSDRPAIGHVVEADLLVEALCFVGDRLFAADGSSLHIWSDAGRGGPAVDPNPRDRARPRRRVPARRRQGGHAARRRSGRRSHHEISPDPRSRDHRRRGRRYRATPDRRPLR